MDWGLCPVQLAKRALKELNQTFQQAVPDKTTISSGTASIKQTRL